MKKILLAIAAMALLFSCNPTNEPEDNKGEKEEEFVEDWSGLTEPQYRKVLIEEYTGINCGYCPDGHRIVNEIIAGYPGEVFAINIHTGTYAANTYTTEDGAAYAKEASIGGYPAGCVNRHLFSSYAQDGGLAMGRGKFEAAAKQIMKKTSPVNIKAYAYMETATRTLTIKVKGYYTATPTDAEGAELDTNYLYVMLLQDSVLGKQNGAASYNPDQVIGGQYCHMHMFRGSLNGTWGEAITPVAATSWFEREYEYEVPETIGKDKVEAVLEHLKVVLFVAEGHKEVYTACEAKMIYK